VELRKGRGLSRCTNLFEPTSQPVRADNTMTLSGVWARNESIVHYESR
jgi:hypothetical protein